MEEAAELPDISFFGLIVKGGTTATCAAQILLLRRQQVHGETSQLIDAVATGTELRMNQGSWRYAI